MSECVYCKDGHPIVDVDTAGNRWHRIPASWAPNHPLVMCSIGEKMRYRCYFCGKSVTSELPDDAVIRALIVCPECMEKGEIIIPEKKKDADSSPNQLRIRSGDTRPHRRSDPSGE